MEFWIELKPEESANPFHDLPKSTPSICDMSFEHDSMDSKENQGQLTAYAVAQMATQFRTFIFSVLICRCRARLICWDCAGAIVTEGFDYVNKPCHLTDFVQHYSHLDREKRGHDVSVSIPTQAEISATQEVLKIDHRDAKFIKLKVLHLYEPNAFYIATSLCIDSYSPIGRGSHAFPAYNLKIWCVLYLKDYWQIDQPGMEKEGNIYADLHQHNVPHILRFKRGDDIGNSTVTQAWVDSPWACHTRPMVIYTLYRMVLGNVGIDLTLFQSSWEYINAIADAMEGECKFLSWTKLWA